VTRTRAGLDSEVAELRDGVGHHTALGAVYQGDGRCDFTVWAPNSAYVEIRFPENGRTIELEREQHGYHCASVSNMPADSQYVYRLDGDKTRADPASRFQPDGVFGPSQVVDLRRFAWEDGEWRGLKLKDYILYELHVGTYTSAGTLAAVIDHLPYLKSLGITAVELMPLAQFPGGRNWGYDGVFPFAVQNSYGGPYALQRFVNACHRAGLAVVLDVVYNHLGPEGNFLSDFGPYFTNRYKTPWGDALNFDGAASDEVVRFFIENAIGWLRDFHIDALRLDAIHGIFDRNAQPFLALLGTAVDEFAGQAGRNVYLIAESDLNDARFVHSRASGGYGLHAQWNDDFHHALHSLQTGERAGYYQDFGTLRHLEKALRCGYVYTGEYSDYRERRQGNSPSAIRPSQLVVFSQNHDQVGNRMLGERTSALLSFEAQKLSAGMVLLGPYIPLLFMGEEYGETAPFLYFTSHQDPKLAEAVREGRRREFAAFHKQGSPPAPQAEETFQASKLSHTMRQQGSHHVLWEFYHELIRLRKTLPALTELDTSILQVNASDSENSLLVLKSNARDELFMIFNFGNRPVSSFGRIPPGSWRVVLNSADEAWMGPNAAAGASADSTPVIQAKSFCLFQRA
jgi:maltooligosyltrehalose trehalohydrolase